MTMEEGEIAMFIEFCYFQNVHKGFQPNFMLNTSCSAKHQATIIINNQTIKRNLLCFP